MLKRLMIMAMCGMAALGLAAADHPAQALQASGGPLQRLLRQVPDNATSRTIIWYGALGDLERLLGVRVSSRADIDQLSPPQRLGYLFEIGLQVYYSPFSGIEKSPEWRQTFGINSFEIEREVTVGPEPPNMFGIFEGNFQAEAIVAALQELGYQPAQVGNVTVYALGEDNAVDNDHPAQRLALSLYNRLAVSDSQIIAAPSTSLMQTIVQGGSVIGNDPLYVALSDVLEGPNTIPGTQLLSAALFGGEYLTGQVITPELIASRAASREALGLSDPLPPYQAAAIGYRRSAQERYLVISLAYADAGAANAAAPVLTARLARYTSLEEPGRAPFYGWSFSPAVTPSADGRFQVLTVTAQLPAQTDVAWVQLVANQDIAFLAVP